MGQDNIKKYQRFKKLYSAKEDWRTLGFYIQEEGENLSSEHLTKRILFSKKSFGFFFFFCYTKFNIYHSIQEIYFIQNEYLYDVMCYFKSVQ